VREIAGGVHCFSMAFLVAAGFWCSGVHAQVLVHFDLPAQPLARSLKAIGTATNTDVGFSASQVAGLIAPALKADLTVDGALVRVLTGTGLRPQRLDDHTIVISATESPMSGSASSRSDLPKASTSQRQPAASPRAIDVVDDSSDLRLAQADTPVPGDTTNSENKRSGTSDRQLEEVVVTGSNIRGVAPVGASTRTLSSAEIADSGYATTEQLLQSLPQNFRGGASGASSDASFSSGSNSGYNNSFGSGVNLRGLGSTATLILVNGHRVASSGSGYFTDISTIPLSAIDHIDVLSDGASAIYGSDAIAGVVNIVLKKDSRGVETDVRYGAANGYSSDGVSTQIGNRWVGGGVTLGADVSHQGSLDVSDRRFTASITSPTSIFPSYTQTALSTAAHQDFGNRLELHADAQYTHRTATDLFSAASAVDQYPHIDRWSGSLGGSYEIVPSWILRYDYSGGVGVEDTTSAYTGALVIYDNRIKDTSRFSDQTAAVSGDLARLSAGSVKLAFGVSYRTESFTYKEQESAVGFAYNVHRNVTAGYGELRIPIFSEVNAVPGLQRLTLSAAARVDDYSDFGRTTNPKYGISWHPITSLEIRGAYSTSFRAPATGAELRASEQGTSSVQVYSFVGPGQSASVAGVYLGGAQPGLQPETAKNMTFGVDYKPSFVPGLQTSLNYYKITYAKQLANPPFSFDALNIPALASAITRYPNSAALQAVVNAALRNGASFYDGTGGAFGSNPLAAAVYLFDGRIANLSSTDTSGFDFTAFYAIAVGADQVSTRLDATYIDRFVAKLTPGSPPISEVNTVGYPARLRLRGLATWTHGSFNVSIAANFVSGYPDTSTTTPREVASFTTFNLDARYNLSGTGLTALHDVVVSVTATNILDRFPPYVGSGTGRFPGSHYDSANADPTGRFIGIGLAKRW
jgi:iron complex outermembrane receptor protein